MSRMEKFIHPLGWWTYHGHTKAMQRHGFGECTYKIGGGGFTRAHGKMTKGMGWASFSVETLGMRVNGKMTIRTATDEA